MEILSNGIVEGEQVGGDWACWLGCGSFCLIGGGTTSFVASIATVL